MKHSDNETLPPNDLALQAFERGAVSLALDILTTGTGRSKEDALLLLHRSAASVVGPEAKRMRPRDVALPKGLFQFVGVFDKAEAEAAAALIVLALQVHSPDEWSTVTSHQVADLLRERHEALISSLRNPFWINVSHVWYWLMPGGGLRQLDGMHPEDAAEAVRWGLGRWEHLSEDERFPYYELEPKNGWGSVAGAIEYMQRIERGCARYPREHYPNHKVRVER